MQLWLICTKYIVTKKLNMKKMLKLLFTIILIFSFNYSYAATQVDHFDIKLWAEETAMNKAVDMTIEAKDKNWITIKDYRWTILILSETDSKAEFPKEIKDNSYTFKELDQWKAKFENALIFKTIWKQQVNVFDFNNEEVIWVAEINIIDEWDEDKIAIKINSPEDWVIVTNNFITLSWETKKNHKVVIVLSWTKTNRTIKTDSNNEWIFEKKIEDLEDWNYTIKASVINADEKEAWVTKENKVTVKTKKPEYNSIKITPLEIFTETKINIELKASAWLSEVKITIDDNIIELIETKKAWVYSWSTTAPKKEWEYDVDIKLVDEIWTELIKKLPKELIVLKLNVACDPEIYECETECNPEIEECNTVINKKKIFKINNLRLTKLKTKSVLSWDPIKEAVSYNIYKQLVWSQLILVDNVRIPTYEVPITWKKMTYDLFIVEPVVIDWSWKTIKWELSQVTEIQTWPKQLLILLFLSFLIWLIIFIFKNKKIQL